MRELDAISDPAERFRRAGQLIKDSRDAMEQARGVRRQSIAEMRTEGLSYAAIGAKLDISRQRVHRIHKQGEREQD